MSDPTSDSLTPSPTRIRCEWCGNEDGPGPSCGVCGRALAGGKAALRSPLDPIRRYFVDLWTILTHPSDFFRRMPHEGGVSGPLAFALITHWLGAAIAFLWASVIGGKISRSFDMLMNLVGDVADVDSPGNGALLREAGDRVLHWVWGAGSIILDPFLTLAQLLFASFFVWIGARLFVTPGKGGAPNRISYETALRILCFGTTPAILAALPVVGGVVANICVVIVTVIGAREVYRISTGRAVVVALFPKLLLFGIMMAGAFFLIIAIFKLATSMM